MTEKPRFEILDGLRGVAALLVLLYHHFEIYSCGDHCAVWVNHGYLAVDFFFILSGYVIGYAYDDRWRTMSVATFFRRRLCRLHPMIVFSTLFGMALFYFASDKYFDPQNAVGLIASCPVWKLCLAGLLGILMIPMPIAWDIRGWNEFCPVNGNAWTRRGASLRLKNGFWWSAFLLAALLVNAACFAASLLVAQLALTFYDKPVRKWLARYTMKGEKR